tara:strand:- start:59 stop:895 length:837 start_codon:yes stop_codon:yes gene_type:complete
MTTNRFSLKFIFILILLLNYSKTIAQLKTEILNDSIKWNQEKKSFYVNIKIINDSNNAYYFSLNDTLYENDFGFYKWSEYSTNYKKPQVEYVFTDLNFIKQNCKSLEFHEFDFNHFLTYSENEIDILELEGNRPFTETPVNPKIYFKAEKNERRLKKKIYRLQVNEHAKTYRKENPKSNISKLSNKSIYLFLKYRPNFIYLKPKENITRQLYFSKNLNIYLKNQNVLNASVILYNESLKMIGILKKTKSKEFTNQLYQGCFKSEKKVLYVQQLKYKTD